MFRVNWGVVRGINELPYCLVFAVTVLVTGVENFNKVVAGCGFLDILEDVLGIL